MQTVRRRSPSPEHVPAPTTTVAPAEAATACPPSPSRAGADRGLGTRNTNIARRPRGADHMSGLPKDILEKIADRFALGSSSAPRLAVASKALTEALEERVLADNLVHDVEHLTPCNDYDLTWALQRSARLPDHYRAAVIKKVIMRLPDACNTPENAGIILDAILTALGNMTQHDQRFATAMLLAGQFIDPRFCKATLLQDGLPTAMTSRFFAEFELFVAGFPEMERAQLKSKLAAGVYMVGDGPARTAKWHALLDECGQHMPSRAVLLESLSFATYNLESSSARETACRAMLAALPSLAPEERAVVLCYLTELLGCVHDAPTSLPIFELLNRHTDALPLHCAASVMTSMLAVIPDATLQTRLPLLSRITTCCHRRGQSTLDANAAGIAAAARHLPSIQQRETVFRYLYLRLSAMSEADRAGTTLSLIDLLAHIGNGNLQGTLLSNMCPQVAALPQAAQAVAVGRIIGTLWKLPPGPVRTNAVKETLLVASMADGAVLKEHLVALTVVLKASFSPQDTAQAYPWVLMTAKQLPDQQSQAILLAMLKVFVQNLEERDLPAAFDMIQRDAHALGEPVDTAVAEGIADHVQTLGDSVRIGIEQDDEPEHLRAEFNVLCHCIWIGERSRTVSPAAVDMVMELVTLAHQAGRPDATDLFAACRTRLPEEDRAALARQLGIDDAH